MQLSRKVRGLPWSERHGNDHVDVGACSRRILVRRRQALQRVSCTDGCLHRTERHGQELESGLCSQSPRRTTDAGFLREVISCDVVGAPLRPIGTAPMGGGSLSISQGVGLVEQPKDRGKDPETSTCTKGSGCRFTITEAPSEVSKETQSWGGGPIRQQLASNSLEFRAAPDVHAELSSDPQPFDLVAEDKHSSPDFSNADVLPTDTEPRIKPPVNDVLSDSNRLDNAGSDHKPANPCIASQVAGLRTDALDLPKWRSMLVPLVLRSRTAFSSFLSRTIRLTRSCLIDKTAPTFFPVPIPSRGIFGRMPSSSSTAAKHARHMSQTVHTMVMALNFWYSGGSFVDDELLRRRPSRHHQVLFQRLRSLCESEGPASLDGVPKAGRRFPELVARLEELTELMTRVGATSSPYDKAFQGVEVPKNEPVPELKPYQDMDPDKILLYGRGAWDATSLLPDDLVMAYREPRSLLHGLDSPAGPNIRDQPSTLSRLAHKWDELGLLHLHQNRIHPDGLVRIFGAMKDTKVHRQIGDRRGQNARESYISGPSKNLPSGPDFSEVFLNPRSHRLSICITDRKDFYHQIKTSEARAISNTIGPAVPRSLLTDTKAYAAFLLQNSRQRRARDKYGDALGVRDESDYVAPPDDCLWVSFSSILQGDHCGVEIATAAHSQLLRDQGLLSDDCNMVANRPLRDAQMAEGLVIDDFFTVSTEPLNSPHTPRSVTHYKLANETYGAAGLLGSPQKDLIDADEGRVIGAYLNCSSRARAHGLATVSAPAGKRLGLAYVSMLLAQLPYTTDSLHLCLIGGWVSALTYRRPLMAILQDSFKVVDMKTFDRDCPRLVKLSRKVAGELVLLSCLMPLACSELSAPYDNRIFCTDASSHKGAILQTLVDDDTAEVLWKSSKTKGAYSRLMTPLEVLLKNVGAFEETQDTAGGPLSHIGRPPAYHFDFLEIFAGASKITDWLNHQGFVCGPPIDLSMSPEYDLTLVHVISWLTDMVVQGRLQAFFLSPPCTTFSIMRRPRLRSIEVPFGFAPSDPQTKTGTVLACRSMQLMYVGARHGASGIAETPYSSYMKGLPAWQVIRGLGSSMEVRSDSCCFGSPHLKSFRFLAVNADLGPVKRRCTCTAKHLVVEGKYTKGSATYTDELAAALGSVFAKAIRNRKARMNEFQEIEAKGLENQLANDTMLSSEWTLVKQWTFRRNSHINILEESSLLKLCSILAREGFPRRVSVLVDSNVVRCATSKGRTSSLGLGSILRRVAAQVVAAGLYVNIPFCPTRLNVADDPTRDQDIRPPVRSSIRKGMTRQDLFDLASIPKLRRWASNWVRVVILLLGAKVLKLSDRCTYPYPWFKPSRNGDSEAVLDFDQTLGFPGEGPSVGVPPGSKNFWSVFLRYLLQVFWFFRHPNFQIPPLEFSGSRTVSRPRCRCVPSVSFVPGVLFWVLLLLLRCRTTEAMPIQPQTPAEHRRASERQLRPALAFGRPVTEATTNLRDRYWAFFMQWTVENGLNFGEVLEEYSFYIEEINCVLIRFGRTLYQSGKSYNQYAETINALVSKKPGLRRMMTGAWDLGFAWAKQEPSQHHLPMPPQILISMIVICLFWGWLDTAGMLALGFGALLRPGEMVATTRADLLLPRDVGHSILFAIVSIREPKSRFTYARHQSTKIDSEDLVAILDLAFGDIPPLSKLWRFSAQTLRNRFKSLLVALHLQHWSSPGSRCLDLGSLRSGGATYIIMMTENSELCRRRGRWANHRMMEVYIQETMALQYMTMISTDSRNRVLLFAGLFQAVFTKAWTFKNARIPETCWYLLLSR